MSDKSVVHPLGSRAKVLLASVFGPYAQNDEYGSRLINPMELYHNQVTRVQGAFSLRMFHRSWGLMLIQANISVPCVLLDFPTRDRFIEEIKWHEYDVVGISSIIPNIGKVKEMCALIRRYQPKAVIVVGGHISNMPDLAERIDSDHIVRGDGVRWFRQYLGDNANRPISHPMIVSGIGARSIGMDLQSKRGDVAATVIPSVGCPLGCNFCSTSAMFGGKGKSVVFYETGDELFGIMSQIELELGVQSFFIMDENFLLHKRRALRLLELMKVHDKAWSLYVFSSASAVKLYTMGELVSLGISWVWMGLEGKNSEYTKLAGTDTRELIRELQSHGIRVLGSSIIGLEEHNAANIDAAIDYAVSHNTEFHQFMLYSPSAGTPLYEDLRARGLIMSDKEIDLADAHGQYRFSWRHESIKPGEETEMLLRAFQRDFEINGPSVVRIVETMLRGWRRHKHHSDPRIRRRFAWEARGLATTFSALVAAVKLYYRSSPEMYAKMRALLNELYAEFGWKSRLSSLLGGPWLLRKIRREEKRLANGFTREPPTFCDRNEAVTDRPELPLCRAVDSLA